MCVILNDCPLFILLSPPRVDIRAAVGKAGRLSRMKLRSGDLRATPPMPLLGSPEGGAASYHKLPLAAFKDPTDRQVVTHYLA